MRELPIAGLNSILSKEHGKNFYNLPIIKYSEKDVCAVAAWDSSVHDSVQLNKVTDSEYALEKMHEVLGCDDTLTENNRKTMSSRLCDGVESQF